MAVFLATAITLFWLGIPNLTGALTYGGRLAGAILLLVAILLIVSIHGTWDDCRRKKFEHSGMVVLIGCTVAFLTNITLLFTAISTGDLLSGLFVEQLITRRNLLPFPVIFLLLSVASAWALYHVLRHREKLPSPRQIGIAALATAVLTAANFGYSLVYQPSARPPMTAISAELGDVVAASDGSGVSAPLSITFKNIGEVDLNVLGTVYYIYGRKAVAARDVDNWVQRRPQFASHEEVTSQVDIRGYDLIQVDRWFEFGGWLNRGMEVRLNKAVRLVNPIPYDELVVRADAVVSRRDKMRLELPSQGEMCAWINGTGEPAQPAQGTYIYRCRGSVHEGSEVTKRIRFPRYLNLHWALGTDQHSTIVGLFAAVDSGGEVDDGFKKTERRPNREVRQMYDRYGIQTVTTWWTEKSLLGLRKGQ